MVSYENLTDQQQTAVDALDRNVVLSAGAGSGKTKTLTTRYLRMIGRSIDNTADGRSEAPLLPENILTTTFTERAANELEESVRTEIADQFAGVNRSTFEAWRTVADELDDGYIHTLHGFCARLLREYSLTTDALSPGFETLDETESVALIDETVRLVLEEHETHPTVETLAQQFSRTQLQDILTDLLAQRPESTTWARRWADSTETAYIDFVETELHPIDPDEAAGLLSAPEFVEAVETLRQIVDDPPDISTGGTAWNRVVKLVDILEPSYDDGVASRSKQTMIAELGILLTKSGNDDRYGSYTGAKTRWDGHPAKAEFDAAVQQIVSILTPEEFAVNVDLTVERQSYPLVQALAALTSIAADEYSDRKRELNAADFTDLVSYAVDLLGDEENADIRDELREQFEYVMVDEFQDTDPRQWDLIKLLTATDGGEFDAENVFVVGDVKQSIYRFRNADVTQFTEIRATLQASHAGTPAADTDADDRLTTNFRTLPTVLETVNELFESVFDVDGAAYEAEPQSLTPYRSDPANVGSVEYLLTPTNDEYRATRFDEYDEFATAEPSDDSELEAMALAAKLSDVLAEPYQVYPGEDEDGAGSVPRDIEPSDIAILIRSRTHLKTYERAFDDAGVPYSVASGLGFYEAPEITALVNLFRALADPSDERALYGVLRSPLFGFTDDTLARLKIDDESLWTGLEATDTDELRDAYDLLVAWREAAGITAGRDDSWAALLTRVIDDTGFIASVSAGDRPQQAVANVEKFREQLRASDEDGTQSLSTLVTRIERQIELSQRESEATTTGDGVQILTIHDAKGMEFPCVVVPGITQGFNDKAAIGGGKVEFERIGEQHAVGLNAPSPGDPFESEETIARKTLRERRRAEERAEEKRTLYVACTRARDHLLLSGAHELSADADELTLAELADASPDAPTGWRDWVQPALLPSGLTARLDTADSVSQSYGDGRYTVSVPSEGTPVESGKTSDPVVEMSPTPAKPPVVFTLSATQLASLFGGYGRLAPTDDGQSVVYVEEERTPDSRHGTEDGTDHRATGSGVEISPTVFGELVHRICELRPPEHRWDSVMEQTLADENSSVELSDGLRARVRRHAQEGLAFRDEQAESMAVEAAYDELHVSAEFENGSVSGLIDHLMVGSEGCHIVDYKTGDVTQAELEDDAEYYTTQMKAYAVALHQQYPNKSVAASLVFTEIGTESTRRWSPAELDAIEREVASEVLTRYPDEQA